MSKDNDRADRYLRIISKIGTPAYLYDGEIVKRQHTRLTEALPHCEVNYVVEANPHADLVGSLRKLGVGVRVGSSGELERVLRAGILANKICYAGPGKTEDELHMAIGVEVAAISVESLQELAKVDLIAKQLNTRANVIIRINTGNSSQLGMDYDQLPRFFELLKKSHNVNFRGIHCFVKTNSLDANAILSQFNSTLELAKTIQTQVGRPLEIVNIGGGFGVPLFQGETALDLGPFNNFHPEKLFPKARIIVEAGRYLVAPAGVYITKVLYTKKSRGVDYVITDGGINHNAFAAGHYQNAKKGNFDIRILNKISQKAVAPVTIAGPLCTGMDILARDLMLPKVETGDFIVVLNSGAYGPSFSPGGFLSHEPPREILLSKS